MIVKQPNGKYLITKGKEYRPLAINLHPLQVKQWYMDNYVHYTDITDEAVSQEIVEAKLARAGVWWGFIAEYQNRFGISAARVLAEKVGDLEYAEMLQVSTC